MLLILLYFDELFKNLIYIETFISSIPRLVLFDNLRIYNIIFVLIDFNHMFLPFSSYYISFYLGREYKSRRHFLRCISTLPDRFRRSGPSLVCPTPLQNVTPDGASSIPAHHHHGLHMDLNTTEVPPQLHLIYDLLGSDTPPTPPLLRPLNTSSADTHLPPRGSSSEDEKVTFVAPPPKVYLDYTAGVLVSEPYWDGDGNGWSKHCY